MIRARIEDDFPRRGVKVWVYRDDSRPAVLRLDETGLERWDELAIGVDVEPTLVLPEAALAAIVAEAGNVLPPSAATDRHLTDAVAVRDRLLTLVERMTP